MIEYRHIKKGKAAKKNKGWEYRWQPLTFSVTIIPQDLTYYEFKIFDIVYEKYDEAFVEALNEARMWGKLNEVS